MVDATPAEVWSVLAAVDAYPHWWPWLRRFEATRLSDGARWSCTVKPPLPYTVSFDLVLRDVAPRRSVAADVEGEIVGTARVDLRRAGSGTELALVSDLEPSRTFLVGLSRLAGPVARFGHEFIIDAALDQFVTHALPQHRADPDPG